MPKIIKSAKGSYTVADITVDGSGRVITASDGSAGGGGLEFRAAYLGPASGTYTAPGTASNIAVWIGAGGGGGGQAGTHPASYGGEGGKGGFGYYSAPISQPFSQPYSVGAGGNPGNNTPNGRVAGGAGGASTLATIATVNGGGGGATWPNNQPGGPSPGEPHTAGTDGTAPGATIDFTPLDYCDLTPANRTGQNPWSNTIRFCLPHDNERAIDILPQQVSLPGLEGRAPPNTNQGDGSRGGLGGIAIYTD